MRARRTVRAFSLAALVALLSTGGINAQVDEPIATPRPEERPGVTTAVLQNELADPAVNAIVDDAASFAQEEIGGRLTARGGRGEPPFRSEILPTRSDVVLRAFEIAQETEDADAPVDLVVLSGGDSALTAGRANAFPDTIFIDVDQPLPCLTAEGQRDPEGLCEGGLGVVPPNLITISFDADQAAYLAGIVAASASRNDRLGVISGTPDCPSCNRIISGFVRGAQSVKPEIDIEVAYLALDENYEAEGGEAAAFGDPAAAHTFARAFIDIYQPDVVLPVAGSASRSIIEAVCESGERLAVGVDFDVAAAYPDLAECVLASIAKDYAYAVREPIFAWANGDLTPDWHLGLDDDRVSVTDEWTRRPGLPVELTTGNLYQRAEEGILTGQIETCPKGCESPVKLGISAGPAAPETSPGPAASASPAAS